MVLAAPPPSISSAPVQIVYAGTFSTSSAPDKTIPIRIDVTSDAEVRAAIGRIEKEQGRLDILVNNAGAIEPISTVDRLTAPR